MTEITEEMVEAACRSTDPLLFSGDPQTEHMAASPYKAEHVQNLVRAKMRAALTAAFASRPSQGGQWLMVGDTVRVLRARNAYGENVDVGKPVAIGETFVVGEIQDDTTYPCRIVFPQGEHTDFWREDDLASLSASPSPYGVGDRPTGHFVIDHDGFAGDVIGHYTTREGKPGVVMQQDGTRVVHVYGEKWITKDQSNG